MTESFVPDEYKKKQKEQQIQGEKPNRIERIEAHLNKLHDFVRSLDARIESLEFESDKKKAIDKAIAAKLGKVKKTWQDEQYQEVPSQEQDRPLKAGQPLRKQPSGRSPQAEQRLEPS